MFKSNRGFTLAELTSAMLASAILMVGFGSVIVLTRKQLSDTNVRVGLGYCAASDQFGSFDLNK